LAAHGLSEEYKRQQVALNLAPVVPSSPKVCSVQSLALDFVFCTLEEFFAASVSQNSIARTPSLSAGSLFAPAVLSFAGKGRPFVQLLGSMLSE